jgi:hypothetical protein
VDTQLQTRFDSRWPQGVIGLRETGIVHNARIYHVSDSDAAIAKIGWGDLAIEQFGTLRDIAAEDGGLVLVAYQNTLGTALAWYDQPENPEATLADLVAGLALALDRTSARLLNFPTSDSRQTLGALTLPALDREETPVWLHQRLAELSR